MVWAAALFLLTGSLMLSHWYSLPAPAANDPQLNAALAGLRAPADAERWMAVHVLYSKCRCSQRLLEHLFTRRALPHFSEKVLLVGADLELETKAQSSGYRVTVVAERDLGRLFHVEAAPLLAIVDGGGKLRYLGGYGDTKQSPLIRDVELLERARTEGSLQALPLLGCAVSESLQRLLDPAGLKSGP
jgi:hypothetical protein